MTTASPQASNRGVPVLFPRSAQFDTYQVTYASANLVDDRLRAIGAKRSDIIDDTGYQVNTLPAGLNVPAIGKRIVNRAGVVKFSTMTSPAKWAARLRYGFILKN